MLVRFRPADTFRGTKAVLTVTDNDGRDVDLIDDVLSLAFDITPTGQSCILELRGEVDIEFDGEVKRQVSTGGLAADALLRAVTADGIDQAIRDGSVRESPGEIIAGHLSELAARMAPS